MKRTLIMLIMLFLPFQCGYCSLNKDSINLYNLQKDNMYIINLDSKAQKINISDEKVVNILPVTSVYEDRKQLFIEAVGNGVCDVNLITADNSYQIRFVTGPQFQDNSDDIMLVDIPSGLKRE